MNIKNSLLAAAVLACLLATGCAKSSTTGKNESSKRFFDSWIHVHGYDNSSLYQRTSLGAYIVEDTPGTGAVVGDEENAPYILVEYTTTDLEGTVNNTSRKDVSQRLGSYSEVNYYGPMVWTRKDDYLYAGLEDVLQHGSFKVGGTRKAVIPGWLFSSKRYSTEQKYIDNVSGSDAIYDIKLVDVIPDIVRWEIDSVVNYVRRNYPTVDIADTVGKEGFYYIQKVEPKDTTSFPTDTTVYINYICRRLDGQVVDTNIADTAKVYGLYSSSSSYSPVLINWGEEYSDITMTSSASSVIDGFAYTLYKMRRYETAISVFYSGYGYSSSGSDSKIPAYSPLQFEIALVDKPTE